jgi:hypothetical protein
MYQCGLCLLQYHVLVESGFAHDLCFHVLHVLIPFVHSHPTIFCMPSVSPHSKFQLVHFLYWNQFSAFWVLISCLRFSLQICGKSGLTSGLIPRMSYPTCQPALNQTVVFSWIVVFLSVVLEPSVWVVLSWWNVVLLVYSEQSRSLEQVLRLSLRNRLLRYLRWLKLLMLFVSPRCFDIQ